MKNLQTFTVPVAGAAAVATMVIMDMAATLRAATLRAATLRVATLRVATARAARDAGNRLRSLRPLTTS